MSQVDINNLSVEQLMALEKNAKTLIKQRQKEEIKKAYMQFQEIAKSLGVSIEDILKAGKSVKNKRPIKYQNPKNLEQGWSGQGRKPLWLDEALKSGKKLEDFLVK